VTGAAGEDIVSALAAPYVEGWSCRSSEPLQRALDDLYDYADDVETRVLHRSRLNLFHRLTRGLVRRGLLARRRRALDLGCNAGYYSKLLSDLGYEHVLGVDIEPRFIERARLHLGSDQPPRVRRFEVADAEELHAPGEFDFILCTEVIEHTARPDRVVANLGEALAPGGVAVVTLPNAVSLPYGWAVLSHRFKRRPVDAVLRDHLSYPFHRALRLFDGHGLRVVETHGTNLLFPGPLLHVLHPLPGFGAIHRANAWLSRLGPLRYLSQFFFLVLRRA
jgi:2-polyprenyl-3-methyl-5-hydroxy-6-metoxy-1,4-benzoquinol methylase